MDGIFSRHLKSSDVHSDLLLIKNPNPNTINNVFMIIFIYSISRLLLKKIVGYYKYYGRE